MKTLLKNGLVYSGLKEPPIQADILMEDDKIIKIAGTITEETNQSIDCTGLSVAPGLIDGHSHNDFFYNYENAAVYYRPFLEQGITTQVTGNCGFSPFGVSADSLYKEQVGAGLFAAKEPGSFAGFVKSAAGNLFVNLVPLIGHGTVRISVNGLSPQPLTHQQLEQELVLVEEAMNGGAFGGSYGFMYEPGMYAKEEELVAFAKKVAQYNGIVTVHPRACSKVAMGYPLLSKPHIELALDEVISLMEQSGARFEYSHLIFVGESSWKSLDPMLKKFYDYRAKGYDIAYDNYSMTYGASVITVICPPWYMALTETEKKTPFNRMRLRFIVNITKKLLGIDYSDITVAYISEAYKKYEGRTIAEIAKSEHKDCLDLYLELIDASGGTGKIYLNKYYNDAIIQRLMEDELSIFMTDAWVEPNGVQNGAAYQGYPNFFYLAKKYGIPFENVIYKMTAGIAERFGIPNRGRLAEGYYADVTIFDPNRLSVNLLKPDAKPEGICHVFVNGVHAVSDGVCQFQRAGKILLKPR